jgi:hypothetical protein
MLAQVQSHTRIKKEQMSALRSQHQHFEVRRAELSEYDREIFRSLSEPHGSMCLYDTYQWESYMFHLCIVAECRSKLLRVTPIEIFMLSLFGHS